MKSVLCMLGWWAYEECSLHVGAYEECSLHVGLVDV